VITTREGTNDKVGATLHKIVTMAKDNDYLDREAISILCCTHSGDITYL
jgi:hypothetical protein